MAQTEIIEIKAKTDKAVAELEELRENVEQLNSEVAVGNRKISKGLKNVEKSSNTVAKGVRGIGTALKAAGIGLAIAAFAKLNDAFTQNQKVADAFNKVSQTASIVFNQFLGVIIEVYESVAKSKDNFDALGKVINGLLTIAFTPLKLTFFGIKLGIQQAQLAWEKSFFGGKDSDKIAELTLGISETKEAIYQSGVGAVEAGKSIVTNFLEAVTEVGDIAKKTVDGVSKISIKAASEAAKTNVELEKTARLAEVANQGLIEKYDRQAEQLRQTRDDESKSFEDRIKANQELGALLDEQEKTMMANANARVQLAAAELAINKENVDLQIAYQEALNEQAAIEAQVTGFRSEQQINTNSLLKEQKDLQNELTLIGKSEREIERLELQQDYEAKKALIEREITDEAEKNDRLIALQEDYNDKLQVLENTKFKMASKTLGNISKAVGENTKAGKAAAAAAALINTYQGITAELATKTVTPFDFVIKLANIATTAAIGFKSVKNILKTTPKSTGAGGAAGAEASAPSITAAQAPAFNIVGTSSTNQLAETIAGQQQQPVKAFVVANDVTTAQSLERNTIQGATI